MRNRDFIILTIALGVFFTFFAIYTPKYRPESNIDNKVSILLSPDQVPKEPPEPPFKMDFTATITNNSSEQIPVEQFYYRLVLARQLDNPGYVLYEFSMVLNPHETRTLHFPVVINEIPASGGNFALYLNLYEDRHGKEPMVRSTANYIFTFQKPVPQEQ